MEERKFWKKYMKVYEQCLSATGTSNSPWYAVPADDKENARLIVSQISTRMGHHQALGEPLSTCLLSTPPVAKCHGNRRYA